MVMHINADLTKAYITSLPRDLLVNVPAFGPSGSGADFTKLTHAMTYGSRVPGTNQQNTRQGFALLAQTVSGVHRHQPLRRRRTAHLHRSGQAGRRDRRHRHLRRPPGDVDPHRPARRQGHGLRPAGPFQHYPVGMQHLNGWQALDYARQRYSLPKGAYDRERHHRQIVKAMITKIFSFDLIELPVRRAVRGAGGRPGAHPRPARPEDP